MTKDTTMKKWGCLAVSTCLVLGAIGYLYYVVWVLPHPSGEIVYIKNLDSRNAGIYTMDAEGNNVKRLTPAGLVSPPLSQPRYSPDGNLIAFGCYKGKQPHVCLIERQGIYPTAPYSSVLFPVFPISGGKTLPDICGSGIDSLTWSPDGQQIALICPSIQSEETKQVCIAGLQGDLSCWPLSFVDEAWNDFSISSSAYIDWAPSGTEFAISFQSKIYLTDLAGQNSNFLTEGKNATWDPTGQHLLFFRCEEMLLIDRDGHNLQQLYAGPQNLSDVADLDERPILANSSATWSPDGRYISFVVNSESTSAIYRLDLRKKLIERLTPKDDGYFDAPDWSP